MNQLKVILPHDIDIWPAENQDTFGEAIHMTTDVEEYGLWRAQELPPKRLGCLALTDKLRGEKYNVPLYEVTFGGLNDSPKKVTEDYFVVSGLTWAAAYRDPTWRPLCDRMLIPFENVRDDNGIVRAVRGLARPEPVRWNRDETYTFEHPRNIQLSTEECQNTCPYPFRIYEQGAPDVVPDNYNPLIEFTTPPRAKQLEVRYAAPEYDGKLSEQLGVPIFNTEVTGVTPEQPEPGESFQLCHTNVPFALENPQRHLIAYDLVRNGNGTAIGGRALAQVNPVHFRESLI